MCEILLSFSLQSEDEAIGPRSKVSLLDQHSELKKKAEGMIVTSYC